MQETGFRSWVRKIWRRRNKYLVVHGVLKRYPQVGDGPGTEHKIMRVLPINFKVYIVAYLRELCLPCLRVKLKYLCLAHRKHPDLYGCRKRKHHLPESGCNLEIFNNYSTIYYTSSLSSVCSVKKLASKPDK